MRPVLIALLVLGGSLAACDEPEPADGGVRDAAVDASTVSIDASTDPGPADAGADAGEIDAGEPPGPCAPLTEPQAAPGDDIDGDRWDTYARGFFESYCTHCHASTLTSPQERRFAPAGMDWDDEASVRAHTHLIRRAVGVTLFMPPGAPEPDCDERRRIVRWIDADAP